MMETFLKTFKIGRRSDDEGEDDINLALRDGDLFQTTAAALTSVVTSVHRQSVTASRVDDVVSEADGKQ